MPDSLTPHAKAKLLRKLAADYRRRAEIEPIRAHAFLTIAREMEADAGRTEASTTAAKDVGSD